jgi:hypothetical protein
MSAAPLSAADPFDAGPYTRLQAALNRHRVWSSRAPLRAVTLAGIAWLPLLALAAVQGLACSDRPQESLLLDPSAYARYLVTLPALVLAEPVCLLTLAMIARYFPEAGLISESDRPRYAALLDSSRSLLDHRGAEVGLVLLAYAATVAFAGTQYPTTQSSWVAPIVGGERHLSLAGWWRLLVSQPLGSSGRSPGSTCGWWRCIPTSPAGSGSSPLRCRRSRPLHSHLGRRRRAGSRRPFCWRAGRWNRFDGPPAS